MLVLQREMSANWSQRAARGHRSVPEDLRLEWKPVEATAVPANEPTSDEGLAWEQFVAAMADMSIPEEVAEAFAECARDAASLLWR